MATKKPFHVKHGLEVSGNTTTTGSILPSANNIYDLGSAEMVWRDVFIGPGSLYVNGTKVIEDDSNTIVVKADPDQSLTVKTTGTGETALQSEGGVNISATGSSDVQITAGGNIEMKSNMTVLSGKRIIDSAGTQVEYGDNIEMNGNKITGVGTPVAGTDAANKTYVDTAVADLVDGAPETLNTLNEIATALGDAEAVTALTTNIGQKLGATASITLQGDVSGSGSFSANAVAINVTVADDSHNHTISNVDGLQSALDLKADESISQSRLANTNAYIATKLDSDAYTAGDVLTKIKTVDGDTSGLDADMLDGQHGSYYRSWTNTTNKPSPTVTLSGDVSGSATLTELGSATIVATIADDSHNHTIANVDGLLYALDTKLNAADYNATDVLTKIKSVDGAGSGLDADLLDGQSSAYYATAASVTSEASTRASADSTLQNNIDAEATARATAVSNATSALWAGITSTNTAVRGYVDSSVAALVDSAPGALNTLNELAAALGDDANFATTVSNSIGTKLDASHDMSLTLSGDASGSATFTNMGNATLSVTVADDSHNHVISNIDGLQTALDGKLATTHDMSLTLSGDVSGSATFTNMGNATLSVTVADDSHNHVTGNIDGFTEAVQDIVGAMVSASGASSVSYNDTAGTLTISSTDTNTDTNTTYSAGAGLDLSGTTFSIESDLRGEAWLIGRDNNDYINVDTTVIDFVLDGGTRARMTNSGTLHVDSDVVAYSSTISDERLKDEVSVVENAVEKVKALRGVEFTYKHDGRRSAGVIAQEVEGVLPQAVVEMPLPLMTGDEEKEYKIVQYDQLSSIFIEAIKEQQAQIEELTKKIEELSK
jgi:hypothetical protein